MACKHYQRVLLKLNIKLDYIELNMLTNENNIKLENYELISIIKTLEMIFCIFPITSYRHIVVSPYYLFSIRLLNLLTLECFLNKKLNFEIILKFMNILAIKRVNPELIKFWERIITKYLKIESQFQNDFIKDEEMVKLLKLMEKFILNYQNDLCCREMLENSLKLLILYLLIVIIIFFRLKKNKKNKLFIKKLINDIERIKTIKPLIQLFVKQTKTIKKLDPNIVEK